MRQYISYMGTKLQLRTPSFKCEGLKRKQNGPFLSVLVQIDPWLRQELDKLETYVKENVSFTKTPSSPTDIVSYRPLWRGNAMYIALSSWCNVIMRNHKTDTFESVSSYDKLGRGTYSISIEVPYVYIGPHKHGEDFSLLLRAVQIVYEPEPVAPTILSAHPSEKPEKPEKSEKKGRRPRNHVPQMQEVKG